MSFVYVVRGTLCLGRTFVNCFALELSVFKTKQLRNTKPLLYPSRSWLTDFLVFHNDRFVRFSLGFGTRNSQFNDLQNCRYAIFILEQIRMVQNPSFTAMKCSHYGAMQVLGVSLSRPRTLNHNKIANPFQRSEITKIKYISKFAYSSNFFPLLISIQVLVEFVWVGAKKIFFPFRNSFSCSPKQIIGRK